MSKQVHRKNDITRAASEAKTDAAQSGQEDDKGASSKEGSEVTSGQNDTVGKNISGKVSKGSSGRSAGRDGKHEDGTGEKIDLKKEIIEWIQIIVAAAAIAFFLNTFIIANSRVPSASMENTIMTGDRVIGSRLSYLFSEPERGDIVIFRYPLDEKVYYVKRLIGLPGETVDIVGGKVYINGSDEPLDEPYLKEEMEPEQSMHFEVPEGCYFFLGDNRNNSLDARYWEMLAMRSDDTDPEHDYTFVERDKLIAKVLFRYYPSIGTVK